MTQNSDPHGWLRPLFAQLQRHPAFCHFAPSHQFQQLLDLVETQHPSKAVEMREWAVGAKHALVGHLASMAVSDAGPGVTRTELCRVCKGDRELRCFACPVSLGIDLRLFEGDEFRRTQLCRDEPAVKALADRWRCSLLEVGWDVTVTFAQPPRPPAV